MASITLDNRTEDVLHLLAEASQRNQHSSEQAAVDLLTARLSSVHRQRTKRTPGQIAARIATWRPMATMPDP